MFRTWLSLRLPPPTYRQVWSRREKSSYVYPNQTIVCIPLLQILLACLIFKEQPNHFNKWGLNVWFHSFSIYNTFEFMCLQLYQSSYDFNLTDPYGRLLETSYKSLHDPHLKAYYKRKDILRRLRKGGYITSNNKVSWRLLPVNQQKPRDFLGSCFSTSLGACINF